MKDDQESTAGLKYACPMHPEVVSDRAGKCSKCRMNLQLQVPQDGTMKDDQNLPGAAQYACPMHPEVVSDKAGICSKCNMNLELKSKPQDKTMPDHSRQQADMPDHSRQQADMPDHSRHQQAGMMDKQDWTIRINSYEPLDSVVGVLSMETGDSRSLQMKIHEEEKGILFKEQGRMFEISNAEGKGGMLCKKHVDKKVKCYGTFSNLKGRWAIHVLACDPIEGEEGTDRKGQGKQDEGRQDSGKQQKMDQNEKSMEKQALFQCPMHPEITATKPGRCTKCGMDLLKKEKP